MGSGANAFTMKFNSYKHLKYKNIQQTKFHSKKQNTITIQQSYARVNMCVFKEDLN